MRRELRIRNFVAITAICAVCSLVGCNAVRPGRKPADTFEAAKRAILEENYVSMWRLVAERSREDEATKIRAQQREVEKQLGNITPIDAEQFFQENGVKPADYVNLTPAEAFAAQVRNTARMAAGLRDALLDSYVLKASIDGETAQLVVEIPGEKTATLRLVRESGLWFIPSVNEFFVSLRLTKRLFSPGKTPQETYDALIACVTNGAYDSVWALLAAEVQAEKAKMFLVAIEHVKTLDGDQKQEFERRTGMPAKQYAMLGPKELLGLELKLKYQDRRELAALMSRRVDGVALSGATGVLTLSGPRGRSNVHLKRQGGKWYLLKSDF